MSHTGTRSSGECMNVKHRSGTFYRSGVLSESVARDHGSDWLSIMVAAVARDIGSDSYLPKPQGKFEVN